MIVSPLIMQRLHTVYPTNIYSGTFNFEKEHMFRNASCIVSN